ncbi:Phosphoserine aminotransferase [Halotydeus destructor]|nr:Phosphoserine aminotransferase [Halotydeus destructor]
MESSSKTINFAAGPAKVPESVLEQAQKELIHYANTGISVMELSHRSADFEKIINNAEADLREIMNIPDNYRVLFLGGGATGQFSSIPMNLCEKLGEATVDYVITGGWSAKATKEAEKYVKTANRVLPKMDKYVDVPDKSQWKFSPDAKYIYYCDNETVDGVQFPDNEIIHNPHNVPVVCDFTSSFLTRPIDVSKYGLIVAGTQKNVGIAGLAIVIVREDLIKPMSFCPTVLNFKIMADNKSLYNTPPCYPIYITGLCLKWIKDNGGLTGMQSRAAERAALVYDVIQNSNGFYTNPVNPVYQSRITVVFRISGPQGEALEKKFLAQAMELGMIQLKGHRSVGGIRAAMYNAMTVDEVKFLAQFMVQFMKDNRQ